MLFQRFKKPLVYFLIFCTQVAPLNAAWAQTIAAVPPNIASSSAKPMLMLTASKDHTLFAPIYTDFEDIDGDGTIDTTFKSAYKYYGYFDATKCYSYNTADFGRFEPAANAVIVGGRYTCSSSASHWSGNFLNWASMTRLDTVRKMLYGGRRSTDSQTNTVLERANVSQDAHSFTKFYGGVDIRDYTPFTMASLTKITGDNAATTLPGGVLGYAGLTICSRTNARSSIGLPTIRLAKGNYRMWSTIETRVCVWGDDSSGAPNASKVKLGAKLARYYGNAKTYYGGATIKHESALPTTTNDQATYGSDIGPDLTVRVKVCDAALLGDERCQKYTPASGTVYKPYGLLQEFGMPAVGQTSAKAEFGLISGSYDQNLTAGALRKNMGDLTNEINSSDGRFCHDATLQTTSGANPSLPAACGAVDGGAISALDRIILYSAGSYGDKVYDPASMTDGGRPAWGNPVGEMVVQALNYYAGNSSTNPDTTTNDTSIGVGTVSWTNPLGYTSTTRITDYGRSTCRGMNILALSSSAVSFDQEASAPFANLPNKVLANLNAYTNRVGAAEGINGTSRAVGISDSTVTKYGSDCSAKTVTNLSNASGICPEAPAVGGSYQVAGAALYGNTSKIQSLTPPSDAPSNALTVKTMAATLGGGVARVEVAIPGTNPKKYVYIVPESKWTRGAGSMLTFSSIASTATSGSFLVTWNDALFAGDHDMDATGYLRYDITGPVSGEYSLKITSDMVNVGSAGAGTHGYSVIGVNKSSAAASSAVAADSADDVYITHGHSRAEPDAVSIAGTMCADTDYRSQTPGAGSYTVTTYPNHVATRAQVGGVGTVYNPCWNSIDSWTLHDVDLPVVGTFKMRGAENVLLKDPLWYAAKYGNYDLAAAGTFNTANAAALPTLAWDAKRADGKACGGFTGVSCSDGVPDGYFLARRPELLERQLREQLQLIVATSNSAPAVSSSQLIDGSYKYAAQFDPTLKKGSIYAYRLGSNGDFSTTSSWDAGELLKQLPLTSRQVITNSDDRVGIPFQWTSLNATYTTALKGTSTASFNTRAQRLVEYMRGAATDEEPNGEKFQARSVSNLMGTIVSSTPWVQNRPSALFLDYLFPSTTESYASFATSKNTRDKLLWVGSNDGMLHGFNAETGAPLLSYVPRLLVPILQNLATPSTSITSGMDGSPFTGDVAITQPSGTSKWSTYLFSSLGRGGRGLFALDVTNTGTSTTPTVTTSLTESNAADIFKWQFSSADDSDLGFVVGDPLTNQFSGQATPIVRLNNGKFAILTPNGPGSTAGTSKLFIIGVDGPGTDGVWNAGVDYYKLSTLATDSGNGMMGASWIDIDNNGTVDIVYATDIEGNIWKFDLQSTNPSDWGSAFQSAGTNIPFYTAKASNGTALAISTAPAFGFPSRGGVVVSFGTGKALASNDFPAATVTNRMFGVYDRTGTTGTATFSLPTGTSTLVQRSLAELSSGIVTLSVTTPVDLATQDGWYFDFPGSSEMLLGNPDERSRNIAFTTVRAADTSTIQCFYTPPGRFYLLDPVTGLPAGKTLGFYVDPITGVNVYYIAVPSADQKVRVTNDRSNRVSINCTAEPQRCFCLANPTDIACDCAANPSDPNCKPPACSANTFSYRVIGKTSDYNLCLRSFDARIQWREVPGLKTRTTN